MKTIVIDLTSENSQDCNWSTADESQNTTGLQNQPNTSTSNQNQVNRESRDTRNPTNPNPTNLKPQTNNRNKDEDVIDQQTS